MKNERSVSIMKKTTLKRTIALTLCLLLFAGCSASESSTYEEKNAKNGIDTGASLKVSLPGKTAPEGSGRDEYDMNSQLRSWILRANAIYYEDSDMGLDGSLIAGGDPQDEEFQKAIKADLKKNSITSRSDLQDKVSSLISDGCYVKSQRLLQTLRNKGYLDMTPEELEAYASKQTRSYEYTATYNTYHRSGESVVMAWDYLRALNRLGRGYGAGYITFDEYEAAAVPIALRLQESYACFEDIDYAYNQGYLFCNGSSSGKVDDTFERREVIAE